MIAAVPWYEFAMSGNTEVTLLSIDGVIARAGGKATKFLRRAIASDETAALALAREGLRRMPEARRHWPRPERGQPKGLRTWGQPKGLRSGQEEELILPALLLASGKTFAEVELELELPRGGGSTVTTPRVEVVPTERLVTRTFVFAAQEEREAHRREGELVGEFIAYLDEERGLACARLALPLERSKLYNDIFVESRNQLIEAKGSARRQDVRMAIGQLADYGFQIKSDERFEAAPRPAILLPEKPTQAILDLLDDLEIAAIWRTEEGFTDNRRGTFT